MSQHGGYGATVRAIVSLLAGASVAAATALVVAPAGGAPSVPAPGIAEAAVVVPAAIAELAPAVPSPAQAVRETGSWISHGYTLELRPDGTGTFAVWHGAFDGTRLQLRLVPLPGAATVADITAIETVGDGALAPDELPGVGGLVTVGFGEAVRTAHVEWTAGPRRLAADLCPAQGLDAAAMAALRCGA